MISRAPAPMFCLEITSSDRVSHSSGTRALRDKSILLSERSTLSDWRKRSKHKKSKLGSSPDRGERQRTSEQVNKCTHFYICIPLPRNPGIGGFDRYSFDKLVSDLRRGSDGSTCSHLRTSSKLYSFFRSLCHRELGNT